MTDDEIIVMAVRKAIESMKPVDIVMAGGVVVHVRPEMVEPVMKGQIPRMVIPDEMARMDPETAMRMNMPVPCPTPECLGDGNYPAPGRGHLPSCTYPYYLPDLNKPIASS